MTLGTSIPIVEIGDLAAGDPAVRRRCGQRIGRACEHVGFLVVADHGIDAHLVDQAMDATRAVFDLPDEAKRALVWDDEHLNRGYDPVGRQRLDPHADVDAKEAWSFGPEWLAATSGSRMQGVNRWPPLEGFREVIEPYHAATMALAERLLRGIALSLDLDERHFASFHRAPVCTLRVMRYPPRHPSAGPRSFGAGAHTDWGAITVLAQDDAGSLEVAGLDGEWAEVPAIPRTFVVNIGDLLQRWTNDRFRSTPHRVRGVAGRDRYSMATFFDLDHDAVIETLPTCISDARPARYPPTTAGEHLSERFAASLG